MSGKGDFDVNDHAEGIGGFGGGLHVEQKQPTSTNFGQQVQADAAPLKPVIVAAAPVAAGAKGLNPNAAEFNADDYTPI